MVEATIRMVDPNVSYAVVRATRGKVVRAEPVAALYEQSKIHHVGSFATLQDHVRVHQRFRSVHGRFFAAMRPNRRTHAYTPEPTRPGEPQPDFNRTKLHGTPPRGPAHAEIRLMMTEIEVRREIYNLISECRKGYTRAGSRIVNDEDADELSWHLFYRMKAKDLLKMEKMDDA